MSDETDLAHFPAGTVTRRERLASGLAMRWYERGQGDHTVLCLHGFPELAVSWRFQFEALADGRRIVAPDLRGYGGTDAPVSVKDYRLDRLCRDVIELLDRLGVERVHLVGHDWGGAIAWELAMRHPDRLRDLAVLNCPPIQHMWRSLWRPAQFMRSWYIFLFQLPGVGERWISSDPEAMARKIFRGTAHVREPFDDCALEPYVRQLRDRGLPGIRYYRAAFRWPTLRLGTVGVPTRLIWGVHDRALGPWFAEPGAYASFVPTFDRVLVESGHWVQQEAPDDVNAALVEHWHGRERGAG